MTILELLVPGSSEPLYAGLHYLAAHVDTITLALAIAGAYCLAAAVEEIERR